jgi:hypothetical protein
MAPSSPILPTSLADPIGGKSSWLKWIIRQWKLIRKNPGGGAAKRFLLILLTTVLGSLVIFTFSLSVSLSLLLRCSLFNCIGSSCRLFNLSVDIVLMDSDQRRNSPRFRLHICIPYLSMLLSKNVYKHFATLQE